MQDFMRDGVVNGDELEKLKKEKVNVSNIMLTIVCNKTMYDRDSDDFKATYDKFKKLGNYILNNTVNVMRFVKRVNGGTGKGMFINLPRDEEIPKIISIENQQGVVETNTNHKLHVHLGWQVRHTTCVQGDDDRATFIASKILGVPPNFIHTKFRATGGLENYIQKYVKKEQ